MRGFMRHADRGHRRTVFEDDDESHPTRPLRSILRNPRIRAGRKSSALMSAKTAATADDGERQRKQAGTGQRDEREDRQRPAHGQEDEPEDHQHEKSHRVSLQLGLRTKDRILRFALQPDATDCDLAWVVASGCSAKRNILSFVRNPHWRDTRCDFSC